MRFFTIAASALLCCAPAYADVIFSSLSNTTPQVGRGVFGPNSGNGPASAAGAQFTPNADYVLTGVTVSVFQVSTPAEAAFNMYLFSDVNGKPGSQLEQIGATLESPSYPGDVTASATAFSLSAGTEYWLVLAATGANAIAWSGDGSVDSPIATDRSGNYASGWSAAGSGDSRFEIDGTLVAPPPTVTPEPTSLLLLGTGTLGMAALMRRRLLSA